MSDEPEILIGFSAYQGTPPGKVTLSFWGRDEDRKLQHLLPRHKEHEGERYFKLTLPGGAVSRWRQRRDGSVGPVDSIPEGDPEEPLPYP